MSRIKELQSIEIAGQVYDFLEAGNTITEIPIGESGEVSHFSKAKRISKTCQKCGRTKSKANFSTNGQAVWCRDCATGDK